MKSHFNPDLTGSNYDLAIHYVKYGRFEKRTATY
jgi:hypothetical protein